MIKTKDRILEVALQLFNTIGLPKVTLRTIAKEMGISQGNLNYHYKKRADIIEALYFQLVKNIEAGLGDKKTEINLQLMFNISSHIMSCSFDYRFFFLDFVQIIRENDTIKNHYSQLVTIRENQFKLIFQLLVSNDIMRKEVLPNEYHNLYKRFHIIGDFWISSAEIKDKEITPKLFIEYSELMAYAIYPYLTEKGREEYDLIVN